MIIEHKNDYWNVLKTQHVKPGKGGAFNQVELKALLKVRSLTKDSDQVKVLKKQRSMKKNIIFYTLMEIIATLWIIKLLNKLKFQN